MIFCYVTDMQNFIEQNIFEVFDFTCTDYRDIILVIYRCLYELIGYGYMSMIPLKMPFLRQPFLSDSYNASIHSVPKKNLFYDESK